MRFKLGRSLAVAGGSLALAGLMAAYSYTSATVANAASISVVDTNAALLALMPGSPMGVGSTPDLDVPIVEQNGSLVFNFNHGLGGGDFGMQGNSTYTWMDMFTVRDNSNNAVNVSISDANFPAGVTLLAQSGQYGYGSSLVYTNAELQGFHSSGQTVFTLQPDEWVEIDVRVEVAPGAALSSAAGAQVIVGAQAANLEGE